jgi:predicted MFS family arabinose efflux permease
MAGAWVWLPESLDFLLERRPAGALARANHLLIRLRLPKMEVLADAPGADRVAMRALLRGDLAAGSLLLCAAFFSLMFTFYFLTSWTPKLLTDYGLSNRGGVSGAVFMNLGGVAGDVAFGLLTLRWTAARLGPSFMIACAATTVAFAFIPTSLAMLMPTAFLLGFLLFGSMACLFAIAPAIFPALARTTGTGLALGVGRIGAVIGPYAGGVLIAAKWDRVAYLIAMAAPLAACAAATYALSRRLKRSDQASVQTRKNPPSGGRAARRV